MSTFQNDMKIKVAIIEAFALFALTFIFSVGHILVANVYDIPYLGWVFAACYLFLCGVVHRLCCTSRRVFGWLRSIVFCIVSFVVVECIIHKDEKGCQDWILNLIEQFRTWRQMSGAPGGLEVEFMGHGDEFCDRTRDSLGTNAISAVGSCHKTVSLWSSVIAASSEDATNAVYYAGSITGKAVLVHETSRGAKQELYEDACIDRSIIMPHTQNRDEWILLKGSGEDKVRFWDWQQEIRDFVRSRPRNSALVRKESSFLKIESNSEIVWLINVYDVDASLCPNMSKGDKLCTVELFDCDVKERQELCGRARLDETVVVRRQQSSDTGLLYAHWNNGKSVRIDGICPDTLFCIDNEIIGAFEFEWDGVYDGMIHFDENMAIGEYRREASGIRSGAR